MTSQPLQLLPSECLPVDVFYKIARFLSPMDIMRLAQADPALTEVAKHYMSVRPVAMFLDAASDTPDVHGFLDAMAPFVREIALIVGHPWWDKRVAAFLANCAAVENLHICGLLRLQHHTTFPGLGRVKQLKLSRMLWSNAMAVCQHCNTDTLRIVHLDTILDYLTRCLSVMPKKIHELQLTLDRQVSACVLPPLQAYLTDNPHLQALNLEYMEPNLSIDLSTLTDHLQDLRTLRLHYSRQPCLQNCAALTALPNLVTLDVHFAQPELIEYLMALTSGDSQSPLQDLCIRIATAVDCAAVPWHHLAALAQLKHLAISFLATLENDAALRCGLSNLPQLRTLKLFNWRCQAPMCFVLADWLVRSFPLLESLSVELLPAAMSRLAELPNLRRLHLIPVLCLHSGQPVRRWRQNAEVGRLLVALSQHKGLRQLEIIPKSRVPVRMSDWRIGQMGEWRYLQTINVSRLLGPRDSMQLSEKLVTKRIQCTITEGVHAEPGFWDRAVELSM